MANHGFDASLLSTQVEASTLETKQLYDCFLGITEGDKLAAAQLVEAQSRLAPFRNPQLTESAIARLYPFELGFWHPVDDQARFYHTDCWHIGNRVKSEGDVAALVGQSEAYVKGLTDGHRLTVRKLNEDIRFTLSLLRQ